MHQPSVEGLKHISYIIDAGGFPIVGFTLRLGQQLKVDCTELLLGTAWRDFKKHLGHGTFLSSSTRKRW